MGALGVTRRQVREGNNNNDFPFDDSGAEEFDGKMKTPIGTCEHIEISVARSETPRYRT